MFDPQTILSIADALPVMVAYCDTGQIYRFCNQAIADWFERPRRDILGHSVREVMGESSYALREAMLDAALAGERQWFAAAFDHPTRGPLTTQAEYIPHRDEQGAVTGVIMVVQDITEQRAAEIALRESEARFRRIADSAPVPMWVTRLDRSRDFVNEAYVALMGVDRDAAHRIEWAKRLHPDDLDRVIAETRAGEASGEAFTIEARFERQPGDYRWMRAVSQPRHDGDGKIVGYIGVATDITVTKESELELRRLVDERTSELSASDARFRAIFDAVLEVIVLLKPDGTVVEVNRTEANWRDPDPRRTIGRKLWEAPTLEAYPQHIDTIKAAIATAAAGELYNSEILMEREGAPTAFLDVSIQPVRAADGSIAWLLFEARDITDLKTAQDQLRQSQKMEALGQLTGGIAHDFNNLLTVVVGGLDLIVKKVEDDRLRRYAENALSAAERGARLTAQLLAFSRVQRLEVRPTQVAPLIEHMRPLLRNVLGPTIGKKFDFDRQPTPVMADPTQLELAVLNLAINARDAMPGGGELRFSTRKAQVADDPEMEDGDYLELSIGDSGCGMAPEVAARAFEPFFTTKEVGKGTGLGLSMVYGVARQSGGTARIESTPGEGTIVKLYFRRAEQDAIAAHAGETGRRYLPDSPRGAKVLVIDDDPDVRAFLVASLEERGHEVRAAVDGASGLERFAEDRPDVVVIDFVMPGLSGADVAREILARSAHQPILFVSGYNDTEAIARAAPGVPVLAKPFRPETLEEAIRDLLAGRVSRD